MLVKTPFLNPNFVCDVLKAESIVAKTLKKIPCFFKSSSLSALDFQEPPLSFDERKCRSSCSEPPSYENPALIRPDVNVLAIGNGLSTLSEIRQGRVGQASLGARSSLLLCRAVTLENEVGLAELVDVDNAVFGTLELFVVELPGRLKNVRPRCQFLRGAVVAFDCVDPGPLHQYRVVVRRVSVHGPLEPAWQLQQHAERTFFVVAPQDRNLTG